MIKSIQYSIVILVNISNFSFCEEIKTQGICSPVITGSNNNMNIYCLNGEVKNKYVKLLFTNSNGFVINGLNQALIADARFSLSINDEFIIKYKSLDKTFNAGKTLEASEHFYKMTVYIDWSTGVSAEAECGGILNAYASAAIIPRIFLVAHPMTGQLRSVSCGFDIRP